MLTRRLKVNVNSSCSFRFLKNTQRFKFSSYTKPSLCSKLCVIGGGKMAEAIIFALQKTQIQNMNDIVVCDVNSSRLDFMKNNFGVRVTNSINEAVEDSDVVLLAVKPQNIDSVAKSLVKPPTGLVLSILAGCDIKKLKDSFNTTKVVRSMPNTPAMVLEAITVWTATAETPDEFIQKAKSLLGSIGEEIEVKDESYLDMATAISGSGPAYVFLTMEAMTDAAVHLGFPRDTAIKLVTSTIKGSASYAQSSATDVSQLRSNVTSPGGTTASALYELEKGGFRTVVADAIWSAYRRALELGGNNPNVGPGRNKYFHQLDSKK